MQQELRRKMKPSNTIWKSADAEERFSQITEMQCMRLEEAVASESIPSSGEAAPLLFKQDKNGGLTRILC